MSTEPNQTIVRRFADAINTDNEAAFLAVLAPAVVDHYGPPGLPPGREGWNMNRKIFRTAFPDGHWQEAALFAEGNRVVGRYILRGTHQGEFFGIPATGNAITVSHIHVFRLDDGKIVEHWGHGDDIGLMRQLGASLTYCGAIFRNKRFQPQKSNV